MKIFWLLLCCVTVMGTENLLVHGDFSRCDKDVRGECYANGGTLSLFTEDLTWNKCGKLAVDQIRNHQGNKLVGCGVWIGGDAKNRGFAVKPDTVYEFSLEIKGTAPAASIGALSWSGNDLWKDRKVLKTTVSGIAVQKEWTRYKGTFKTPSDAKRAALNLQLWWNDRHGQMKYKVGDYILFDNLSVCEAPQLLKNAKPEKVQVTVTKTAAAIAATPSEEAWKKAPEINDFPVLGSSRKGGAPTSLKVLYRADTLFLRIRCDENMGIVAKGSPHGTTLWRDDAVELFFGPRDDSRQLSQFAASAAGAKYYGHGERKEVGLYDRWEVKAARDDKGYMLDFTIPVALLGGAKTLKEGEVLSFNAARQRRNAREIQSWAPLKNSLHDPSRFGKLLIGGYGSGVTRERYEQAQAEKERQKLQAQLDRLSQRSFVVAPVSGTDDFSVPYLPQSLFNPPESIRLQAAGNELKPLILAVANLTGQTAACRVIVEHVESGIRSGAYGLKDFPAENIVIREALRVRDGENGSGTLFDPLACVNGASVVTIPAGESVPVWIDFDTAGVKPGTYSGRIRVIPLTGAASFKTGKAYHEGVYSGAIVDVPLTLEVLPFELARDPGRIQLFFGHPPASPGVIGQGAQLGASRLNLNPWSLKFPRSGNTFRPEAPVATEELARIRAFAQSTGRAPEVFVVYCVYDTFMKLYPKADLQLFAAYIRTLQTFLTQNGFRPEHCHLELFDEPHPKRIEELVNVFRTAREAAPDLRLVCTLGAHLPPVENLKRMAPYVDEWILWTLGYFNRKEYLDFVRQEQGKGRKVLHYTCDTSPRSSLQHNYRRNPWFGEYHKLDGNAIYQFLHVRGNTGGPDWKLATTGNVALVSFDECIPTIRSMAIRQGVTDIKYLDKLRAVAANDPEVKRFLERAAERVVVSRAHDPNEPDKVREEAARLILKKIQR